MFLEAGADSQRQAQSDRLYSVKDLARIGHAWRSGLERDPKDLIQEQPGGDGQEPGEDNVFEPVDRGGGRSSMILGL